MRRSRKVVLLIAAAIAVGCAGPDTDRAPDRPRDVSRVPDAVPRAEPRSASGNPPFYEVMGRRYYVLASADGHRERGVASWYGEKFHGRRTSSGETYDMYAMTAAHKTVPIPAYARVTNLQNGRSVVVRINDRGPFVANRVIDLSYAAAHRLDMIRDGTAMVEVEIVGPDGPAPQRAAPRRPDREIDTDGMFVQAGAFRSADNARRLVERIRDGTDGSAEVFVREDHVGGQRIYRVRIGPVSGVDHFDRIVQQMTRIGIADAYLALD